MKLTSWAFSMIVSTSSGTFAVTSWAVEGLLPPAATSAQSTLIGSHSDGGISVRLADMDSLKAQGSRLKAQGVTPKRYDHYPLSQMKTYHLASDGADYVGGVKRRGL